MKRLATVSVVLLGLFLAAALYAQDAASAEGPSMTAPGGALVPFEQPRAAMDIGKAVVLGLVEGITEFLPVSSTGHLAVAQKLMGLDSPEAKGASDAYAIVIQAGAILAVLIVSFGRVRAMVRGIAGRDRYGLRLLGHLAVAFVPAAVAGLFLEDRIKQYLFGFWPIAAAWLAGGVFILAVLVRRSSTAGKPLEGMTWKLALVIGLCQAIALWPGVSRSLVTIAAASLAGMSIAASVEFSFLLGLVTLGAATGYEAVRKGPQIIAAFGWTAPVIGFVVAAIAAFVAVKAMVTWLRTRSLAVFGWYRIVAAALAVLVALR